MFFESVKQCMNITKTVHKLCQPYLLGSRHPLSLYQRLSAVGLPPIPPPYVSDCQQMADPPSPYIRDYQQLAYPPSPLCQRLSANGSPPFLPLSAM